MPDPRTGCTSSNESSDRSAPRDPSASGGGPGPAQVGPARASEARAAERLRLLAEAGAVLGASLDMASTLRELSHLLVPQWADWCFVEMPRPDGSIKPVIVHHSDPALLAVAWEGLRRYPVDPAAPLGTAKVLRTGEPELVEEITDDLLRLAARDEEHYELLRQVGFRSHVSVPLQVRERTIGVLSLVMAESGRRFGADDITFAGELARRTALALDNSQLFAAEREARELAERSADHARRLAALAAALNEATTEEQVGRACIESGAAALGAQLGSLALLTEAGDELVVVHSSYGARFAERWSRFRLDPRKPLSSAVLRGEPVMIEDVNHPAEGLPTVLSDFAGTGTVSFVAIPIRARGRPLGGLSFSFTSRQVFDDLDRTFAMALGEQAAQSLERALLLASERAARSEAEEANRAKTQFLSAMSHELRTPLNAIAGYVDLLDAGVHGPLTAAQRHDLERVRRAQNVLLSLINDVLNFARLEAGRIEFRDEAVAIEAILDDLEELMGPQVRDRGLRFERGKTGEGLHVRGDAERIQQILLNLVGNAAKFTDPGGRVLVSVRAREETVGISVSDTGRGISPEKLETIFEPFVQLDRQGTRESQQGVGLGLAISRELARAMGGQLEARSTLGEGSEFELVLPRATVR